MNTSQIVTIFSIVSLLVVFYIIYKLNKNDEILKAEIDKINNNVNDINSILLLNNKKNILNKNIDEINKKTDISSLKEDYDNYVKTNYDELDGLEPLSDNLKIEMDEIGEISNDSVLEKGLDSNEMLENNENVLENNENVLENNENVLENNENVSADAVDTVLDAEANISLNRSVEDVVENALQEAINKKNDYDDEFDIEFQKSETHEELNEEDNSNSNSKDNQDDENDEVININFQKTEENNEIETENTPHIITMLGQDNDIEQIVCDEMSELSTEKKRDSEVELEASDTDNVSENEQETSNVFGEKNLNDINNMTLKELQNIARENKLKVTGKKDILIERVKALYNLHNNMHH